ncbi:E3 ubiquitin-protein ligase RSL1-like [Rhododendron vialii]|uniref:E3 ubiquitin-protein ligase RSL1-like n=1 Tax=Rhododendron vialii TaxID=182163 RepID=UPI00265EDB7F|nr:E3 ubiquitin-protein ligase RSL1-like [Rhododendron vialii]
MGNKNSTKRPFTCEICIEPMLSNKKKFQNNNLCVHPFCNECIAKYVQFKIEDDRVAGIKCPGSNCDKLLDPLCCRALIPPKAFDRWCDLLCDRALLGLDRCYCPNRDCSAEVVNECGGIVKKSKCPNCKEWFCFKCRVTWHAGYLCEELRDWSDVAFADFVARKKWMRCPKCRHCVERFYGCSFIKCRCGSSFCYKCGKEVYDHRCDCKGKANNEDTTNNNEDTATCTCTGGFIFFFQKFM